MSQEVISGSREIQNENVGPDDPGNPAGDSNLRERIMKEISEKQREIARVRQKRKKLHKKHKHTAEMLTYLCSKASELRRGESPDPGAGAEDLEEKHRTTMQSALNERQLLLEQYSRQYDGVNRLIGTSADQNRGASDPQERFPGTERTPMHDSISFVQPTPEREEILEEYLKMGSARTSPPRARQELFNGINIDSLSDRRAEIVAKKRELCSLEAERDEMVRQCEEIDAAREESLMGEVRREREKYASLLEERRVLEETQTRMSQRMASPGPPPIPDYAKFRQNSDMEMTCTTENGTEHLPYFHTDIAQGPEYSMHSALGSFRPRINPSHSLSAVLSGSAREVFLHAGREWEQDPELASVSHRPEQPGSVLHDISDKLSLLLQQKDQTLQQPMLTPQPSHPIYTSSQPPVPPATTPVPNQLQQFTSYPPNTPSVELPTQLYSTNPHQFYSHCGSLPSYLSYPPPLTPSPYLSSYPPPVPPSPYVSSYPPVTPSPFSNYPLAQNYFVPPPYSQSSAPYLYPSLANPAPLHLPNQWTQTLHYPPAPPQMVHPTASFTPAPPHLSSQDALVPLTASCTQTDLTFQENPLSSQHLPSDCEVMPVLSEARRELPKIPTRREDNAASLPHTSAPFPDNPPYTSATPQEIPLFEQVREQIYSEVASLLSGNESRPVFLLEFLRTAQLLNKDDLREAGVRSLKRIINNFLNQEQIDAQAFSAIPSVENPVHSPTQNFPLARHYLNTDLSGSSENVGDRCPSRSFQWAQGLQKRLEEAQSEMSELTDSELSSPRASPWDQQVRELVTRLIPVLKDNLDQECDPKLLALIHQYILMLFSELFSPEVVQRVGRELDTELKEILSKYRSNLLKDCGEELLIDVSELFFAQMDNLVFRNSIELSNDSDEENSEREGRDQARDDALAAATDERADETICLSDSTKDTLAIQGHQCSETTAHLSPTLSPPNIINLTLSECKPMDDDATSEKSEDYSQSKTVDTISETASCTASDLSEINPHRPHKQVNNSAGANSPKHSDQSTPSDKGDSVELPPFANVALAQGSFTFLNRAKETQVLDLENNDFISEVMPPASERLELTGEMLEILPPSTP